MPTRISTIIICIAAIFLSLNTQEIANVNRIFTETAAYFGIALIVALTVEASGGAWKLLRTDILMLIALYGLVFLEFMFPQESFVGRVSPEGAQMGTTAALIGFAGIALGRHLAFRFSSRPPQPLTRDLSNRVLIKLFVLVVVLGYLHILLAVHFDVLEAIRQMSLPRFHQSWSRGRLGGLSTLLYELGLLIFLIPPIAGVVFAQFRQFGTVALLFVAAVLVLTLFKGFSSGTRSVFIVHIITFTMTFILCRPRIRLRDLLMKVVPLIFVATIGSTYMLEFRQIGLSKFDFDSVDQETLFVDLNLINISRLTEVFPESQNFLGWEIPYHALIRPIPRAIWPAKPLSATFVGETYMAGGHFAVAVAALILGSLAATWNRVGRILDSRFNQLLYATGFFAAALAMRSVLQVMPAILPPLALWLFGQYFLKIKSHSHTSSHS
jgi:hypothetical protein